MTKNHDFFKPENVDEQVEQFFLRWPGEQEHPSQAGASTQAETLRTGDGLRRDRRRDEHDPSVHLVRELQAYYQAEYQQNRGFLARARQRINAHQLANHGQKQGQDSVLSASSPVLSFPQERTRMTQHHSINRPSGKRIFRTFGLLAAALVAVLLVGTVAVVMTLSRNYQSNLGAPGRTSTMSGSPTAAPLPAGTVVYTRLSHPNKNISPFLAWSPDSQRIASLVFDLKGLKTQLQIWHATTGSTILTVPLTSQPNEVLWSPDGKYLALDNLAVIVVVDSRTGQIVKTISYSASMASSVPATNQPELSSRLPQGNGYGFYSVAWSPDGKELAVAVSYPTGGNVELLNPLTGAVDATFSADASAVGMKIALSSDGQYLAVAYPNISRVVVWQVATRAVALELVGIQADNIAWQPGTHHLARIWYAAVQLWDVNSKKLIKTYQGFSACAWSPDGKTLALYTSFYDIEPSSRTGNGKIALVDAASGTQVALYKSQLPLVIAVFWSPDGRYIASSETIWNGSVEIVVWSAFRR